MIIDRPKKSNGVLCVMDCRSRTDKLLERQGVSNAVYRKSPFLSEMFGRHFSTITRAALFDHGTRPTSGERHAIQREYETLLKDFNVVCIFPTPSSDMAGKEEQSTKGTLSWSMLHAPDNVDEMRGAFWWHNKQHVVPMYPCLPIIDETQKVMNQQWAQWAVGLSTGPWAIHVPEVKITQMDEALPSILERMMRSDTLSVDIETIDSSGTITALGIADSRHAISLPVDRFQPSKGGLALEPGLDDYGDLGKDVRASVARLFSQPTCKVGQNIGYDLPRLRARGWAINGQIEDTLAAHAVVYPTLKHGLQKACATMFPCPPWKSLFKAPGYSKDDERFWSYEPAALRDYNSLDAWYTWQLWQYLRGMMI